MAGFKWAIDFDTSGIRKGGQQAADAIDNATDAFKDMTKEADRAGDKAGDALGDGVKDGVTKADRALEKLEDAFKEAQTKGKKVSKTIGDDLGDDVSKGAKRAEEGMDELSESAGSNAKEVAASFDGSVDSLADGFQGLAAEAFAGFGPAGLVAGAALTAVGGAMFNSFQENSEKSKAAIASMYEDMTASGNAYLSQDAINQRMGDIASGAEEAAISTGDLRKAAEDTGISQGILLRAFAGDSASMATALTSLRDQQKAVADEAVNGNAAESAAAVEKQEALQGVIDKLTGVGDQLGIAGDQASLYQQGLSSAGDTADVATEKFQGTADAANAIPDGKTTKVDADTQPAKDKLDAMGRPLSDIEQTRTVRIEGQADLGPAERAIQQWIAIPRRANITPDFVKGRP